MDTGFPASRSRGSVGPRARRLSHEVPFEGRSPARPHSLMRRLRSNRQSEQSAGELSDLSQYDKMTSGERLPLSVFIALLLGIAGLIGLIAFAIAV
jgi:hypothetical protein